MGFSATIWKISSRNSCGWGSHVLDVCSGVLFAGCFGATTSRGTGAKTSIRGTSLFYPRQVCVQDSWSATYLA